MPTDSKTQLINRYESLNASKGTWIDPVIIHVNPRAFDISEIESYQLTLR